MKIVEYVRLKRIREEEESEIILRNKTYKKILAICSKCSSEEVYAANITGFFSAFKKRDHICNACGEEWRDYLS